MVCLRFTNRPSRSLLKKSISGGLTPWWIPENTVLKQPSTLTRTHEATEVTSTASRSCSTRSCWAAVVCCKNIRIHMLTRRCTHGVPLSIKTALIVTHTQSNVVPMLHVTQPLRVDFCNPVGPYDHRCIRTKKDRTFKNQDFTWHIPEPEHAFRPASSSDGAAQILLAGRLQEATRKGHRGSSCPSRWPSAIFPAFERHLVLVLCGPRRAS